MLLVYEPPVKSLTSHKAANNNDSIVNWKAAQLGGFLILASTLWAF